MNSRLNLSDNKCLINREAYIKQQYFAIFSNIHNLHHVKHGACENRKCFLYVWCKRRIFFLNISYRIFRVGQIPAYKLYITIEINIYFSYLQFIFSILHLFSCLISSETWFVIENSTYFFFYKKIFILQKKIVPLFQRRSNFFFIHFEKSSWQLFDNSSFTFRNIKLKLKFIDFFYSYANGFNFF